MKTIQEFDQLLSAMIKSFDGISDLLFVAGQKPQVEAHGVLETPALNPPEPVLTGERIERMARLILNDNAKLLADLSAHGSCDCSHPLSDTCRFRVNIYRQNGTYAMVLRRLQPLVPTMDKLGLPPAFNEIVKEKNGLVFVTGGSGNGKSTTLAALLNEINRDCKVHVVTLEDPVEFLHPQLNSTFSQREMGRDFFSFPDGLRAALRQAPKVIFVGEIRDRETMEIALIAGETGHLVFSTLHTISADQTIYRILGMFTKDEEQQVRKRLSVSLRYIVGQRLVPKKMADGCSSPNSWAAACARARPLSWARGKTAACTTSSSPPATPAGTALNSLCSRPTSRIWSPRRTRCSTASTSRPCASAWTLPTRAAGARPRPPRRRP